MEECEGEYWGGLEEEGGGWGLEVSPARCRSEVSEGDIGELIEGWESRCVVVAGTSLSM